MNVTIRAILVVLFLMSASNQASSSPLSLRLIGQYSIPTGYQYQEVEFGGISGIDRALDGSYYALSDNPGSSRGSPRFYNLTLNYDGMGFQSVTINRQVELLQHDGLPFSTTLRMVDPESIRQAINGNLYWTSEGIWHTEPDQRFQPFVREMTTDGVFVRQFSTPGMFNFFDNESAGGRNNKLFEALAVAPEGTLYVANEDALFQDGNITTLTQGSVIRVTKLDVNNNQVQAQYAYTLPPIPVDGAPGTSTKPEHGLAELLAISDTQFIALERAFAPGFGNTIRLVFSEVTPNTTDISKIYSLQHAQYTPMSREVLVDMSIYYEEVRLDNIESLSWGHTLENGNRTLVLVSDNNYSTSQETQFLAFEVALLIKSFHRT
jgi:hypothetical protein